jgi:hypothetical protein
VYECMCIHTDVPAANTSGATTSGVCITIIDTIILHIYTNNAYIHTEVPAANTSGATTSGKGAVSLAEASSKVLFNRRC